MMNLRCILKVNPIIIGIGIMGFSSASIGEENSGKLLCQSEDAVMEKTYPRSVPNFDEWFWLEKSDKKVFVTTEHAERVICQDHTGNYNCKITDNSNKTSYSSITYQISKVSLNFSILHAFALPDESTNFTEYTGKCAFAEVILFNDYGEK